jgi:transposase
MDRRLYRARYRIENCFCRLKRWASIDTRRNKLASRYLSLVTFTSVVEWLR